MPRATRIQANFDFNKFKSQIVSLTVNDKIQLIYISLDNQTNFSSTFE